MHGKNECATMVVFGINEERQLSMNNNLEKLGDEIRKTVQDAVENQNYERLNQMISETLNKAAKSANDTVKNKYNGYKTYTTDFEHAKRASREAFGSYQGKKQVPVKIQTKLPSKIGNIALTVLGYSLGGIEFIWLMLTLAATFFVDIFAVGGPRIGIGIVSALAAILSALGFLVGITGTKKMFRINRFQEYLSAIGKKEYCNVSDLSKKVGKSNKIVLKDLEYMIRKRWFLQGHLDDQKTCLMVSDRMYEEYQQLQHQRAIEEKASKEEAQKRIVTGKTLPPEVQKVLDQGDEYVKKIRKCNDDIPGIEISEKIDRIEMLVDKIFDRVEQNPKNVSDIRKLMDYYLPTTVKLLEAYAQMDAQPVGGENIQTAKKEIEDTLDTLNVAFEKILDDLFQETAWDVSSDISVLNTMLAQEGLKEDGLKRK